jgi:outer membrane protein OmpA-like peptidoglycan-associated protein
MNRELGAQAFTHGSDVYFGAGKSQGNNELTAHELTHVVQQSGSQLQTKQIQQSPTQRTEEDKIQRQSPLDWLTDRVGDALNSRDDEERLDAEEALTDFMSEDYEVTNHHPTTGRGLFDATYQPRSGAMTVTVKICFQFASGDRKNAEWITGVGGPAAAATYTDEQFDWQDGEADAWKGNAIAEVEAAWSEQYTFHNTRQHWEALPNVNVRIDVVEAPADEAHYVTTVNKWPKDGGLSAGVVPPGDADQSTAHFEESADNGITNPDSSHRVRTTNTRAAYQIVDTNNPGQILFNMDSTEVSAADQARLQTFGQTLGRPEIPPFPVTLTGHSSSEGDEERNMRLSEDRARVVSNEIVSAGAKSQPTVAAKGEEGADATPQWRRVDITVGRFESDQTTVLHEFGHMFGLGDEYPTSDGGSRDVGTEVAHSDLAETLIPGQQPIVAHHDESIMSNGEVIRPHHYVTFLEALGTMTSTTGQWEVGPGSAPRGPGDFPTRGSNDPIPA